MKKLPMGYPGGNSANLLIATDPDGERNRRYRMYNSVGL